MSPSRRVPGIVARHPALRWVAPATVSLAVVTGVAALASNHAVSHPSLMMTDPASLVAAVRAADQREYSGTLVTQLSLGLPDELRSTGFAAGLGGADSPEAVLLDGSHTVRFYYGGKSRQRLAILGSGAEFDIVRDGSQVWQWNSRERVATRRTVASLELALPMALLTPAELTPAQLADRLLTLVGGSTDLTLRQGGEIADRPTYELTLTPRSAGSRIASARIEVDGTYDVPLGVQIYARGAAIPAVDVSFTSVTFSAPDEQNFDFRPPIGSTVHRTASISSPVSASGTGWLAVAEYPDATATAHPHSTPLPAVTRAASSTSATSGSASPATGVSGSSGAVDTPSSDSATSATDVVEQSPLLSTLITSGGQVLTGAVDPDVLHQAAKP